MSLSTKDLGAQTELQCLAYLHGLGYNVSIPWGDNARYDFILDIAGKLYKIQAKTSRKSEDGVYRFNCKSTYLNTKGNRTVNYKPDEIDYFCTFIEEKCYLIPILETGKTEKVMRFTPPKNGQIKDIIFADTNLAETQIEKLMNE